MMPVVLIALQRDHMRHCFRERERGYASVFALFVVIPLLLVGLTVTVELGNFFSVREEVRGLVDREALAALRERASGATLEARMRERLKVFEPMVTVGAVQTQSRSGKMQVFVEAGFHSYIAELLLLLGGKGKGWVVPFTSVATVRKVSSSTLVVLDRLVADQNRECSDDSLLSTESFVSALNAGFQRSGAAQMSVAVFPGGDTDVQMVSPAPSRSTVALCGSEPWRVRGILAPPPDPMNIVFDLGRLLSADLFPQTSDRHVLLLVLRRERGALQYLTGIIQQLGGLMQRLDVHLSLVVVRVDAVDTATTGLDSLASSMGLNYREVSVSSQRLVDRDLITAVVSEIAERIVVAE